MFFTVFYSFSFSSHKTECPTLICHQTRVPGAPGPDFGTWAPRTQQYETIRSQPFHIPVEQMTASAFRATKSPAAKAGLSVR
jgi:hypothetical protein